MKREEWKKAKERLKEEYLEHGITQCEVCGSTWALSFHHLERRSSGKAENTFEGTRLLCCRCHHRADNASGYQDFNERLKDLR